MTWLLSAVLLGLAAPYVLWPLITHWQPEGDSGTDREGDARNHALEELELDVAAGRLSPSEAGRRRRELD